MKKNESYRTVEEDILYLQQKGKNTSLSIGEVLHILSVKWQSLFLLFLSLPFCQPLQIPGFSTPFGLVISFIGLRMTFGKYAWLPKGILTKKIKPKTLQNLTENILWAVKKMKPWVHPRLVWLCHYPALQIMNGLLISILGIFLALPLPIPLSNLIAAWSIFFIGLGLLEDDGFLVLIGYLISLFAFAFLFFTVLLIKTNFSIWKGIIF